MRGVLVCVWACTCRDTERHLLICVSLVHISRCTLAAIGTLLDKCECVPYLLASLYTFMPYRDKVMSYLPQSIPCFISHVYSQFVGGPESLQKINALLRNNHQHSLVDFDSHLEDVILDWLNPAINEVFKNVELMDPPTET